MKAGQTPSPHPPSFLSESEEVQMGNLKIQLIRSQTSGLDFLFITVSLGSRHDDEQLEQTSYILVWTSNCKNPV